ncbi:unnamed protein product [Rotaria magnacalcarata]|uniref:Uncharacterized protein n=1 Tax=Rotaria magnacalcarata TaxID=392030 RepID=A0A8S3FF76_9BILA|nr:unnamed protein product [Rotaria magnacalcarata]
MEYLIFGFGGLRFSDQERILPRTWDGSVRFMPRLKLCLIKQNNSTSNKNYADDDDQIVSIDNENESMESDVE